MKRTPSILLTYLLLIGLFAMTSSSNDPSPPAEKIRIACVGDSITYGHGISDREHQSYPAQLQALLGDAFRVENFGVSGSTMLKRGDKPYWVEPEFNRASRFEPNIVIMKLGTNDLKMENWRHADQFVTDYLAMIEHFRNLPSAPTIYICYQAPIFWGGLAQEHTSEVRLKMDEISDQAGVPIIDLYTPLKSHPEYLPDGVHPNAAGAMVMAKTIRAFLLEQTDAAESPAR